MDLESLDLHVVEEFGIELSQTSGSKEDHNLVAIRLHRFTNDGDEVGNLGLEGTLYDVLRDMLMGRFILSDGVDEVKVLSQRDGSNILDILGHSSRVEKVLTSITAGQERKHLLDRGSETHVKKLIGLVEDEHAKVRTQLLKRVVLEVIIQATGSGHEDVRNATAELSEVTSHLCASHDTVEMDATVETQQLAAFLLDLLGELAGRGNDKGRNLALAVLGVDGRDTLDSGNQERECLSGTGLGFGQHISSRYASREGSLLNTGHELVTESLGQGLFGFVRNLQRRKRRLGDLTECGRGCATLPLLLIFIHVNFLRSHDRLGLGAKILRECIFVVVVVVVVVAASVEPSTSTTTAASTTTATTTASTASTASTTTVVVVVVATSAASTAVGRMSFSIHMGCVLGSVRAGLVS